ncbi:imidazolonepropionase [Novipirellula aureliae]|uniref:Imidazolonepropionase n=1 Tax=Novipirellula aureliae TaxID=2527966 RepID=A0A5C6E8N9_9BACT|nr:amidohydrolase family protein [Novipirellula aureliae]TWU45178.1 imidazolonepropionase [Novipirellula aureliae]
MISLRTLFLISSVSTFCFSGPLVASDQVPGAPQTKPILIRGATLHPVSRKSIVRGSILFDSGRIVAIGKKVDVPDGAVVIEAEGKHVYPGLIESYTDLGLREISAVDATADHTEFGSKNPNVRSWVAVNPDSELIPVARAGGVLLAHVAPAGPFVQGQSAVMQLDGWTANDMKLLAPAGLCVHWSSMHPSEKDEAKAAEKQDEKWQEFDAWIERAKRYAKREPHAVATDLRLESLQRVINREVPLIVSADRQAAIESAVLYAMKQNLRLIIYGGFDATSCSKLLKQHDVAVIIAGTHRLPLRRDDPYDAAYTLPERLRKAGVRFAIAGEGPGYPDGAANVRNLTYHAACAIAYGLPSDVALRSITLSPAEILGVSDRTGSLEVGKDATIIITDDPWYEPQTNVEQAYIQGRKVDLTSKHTMLSEKYKKKYRQGKTEVEQ